MLGGAGWCLRGNHCKITARVKLKLQQNAETKAHIYFSRKQFIYLMFPAFYCRLKPEQNLRQCQTAATITTTTTTTETTTATSREAAKSAEMFRMYF